jgi:hypothetical protein
LFYYCSMRESLKNVFSNHITLEDKSKYYYTVQPYELVNALGNIIAVLEEYSFTKKENSQSAFSCKLYKTKEGNWYDIEDLDNITDKAVLRMLKTAIDAKENKIVLD